MESENTKHCFYRTRSAQEVAYGTLGAADIDIASFALSMLSQH